MADEKPMTSPTPQQVAAKHAHIYYNDADVYKNVTKAILAALTEWEQLRQPPSTMLKAWARRFAHFWWRPDSNEKEISEIAGSFEKELLAFVDALRAATTPAPACVFDECGNKQPCPTHNSSEPPDIKARKWLSDHLYFDVVNYGELIGVLARYIAESEAASSTQGAEPPHKYSDSFTRGVTQLASSSQVCDTCGKPWHDKAHRYVPATPPAGSQADPRRAAKEKKA